MKILVDDIKKVIKKLGLSIENLPFTYTTIRTGANIELEHGKQHKLTNITNDNVDKTVKIALAHLFEDENYYKKLKRLKL